MATANTYHGYCCKCGAEVQAGLGRIRRYSGANKRSAPAGSRSRRTHGYNGYGSDNGPGAMGKYAVFCTPCDDADQQAKKDARKLEKLNEKIYDVWNKEVYRLHGEWDRVTRLCCEARDSGDAAAWQAASDAQRQAYAVLHDFRAKRPVFLTDVSPSVQDTPT